jgi:surface polysaccharide O-acyltransferase-like enzyme
MEGRVAVRRSVGIDALRVVSMFMVVVLHVLGPGGILGNLPVFSVRYEGAWLLECGAFCAVNCYGLVTGYVSVDGRHKYSRLMSLWAQVAFYTVGITAVFAVFSPVPVQWSGILSAFFPVCTNQYWYFTSYFGLFFFIPVLNHLVHTLPANTMKKLMLTILVVCSVLPSMAGRDLFLVNAGYSMLWLICLYLIGAYLKTYGFPAGSKRWYLLGYVFCVGGAWLSKLGIERFEMMFKRDILGGNRFISYSSPFILFAAIFLLLFFSQLECKSKLLNTCIKLAGPVSFGVYLIHVNPLVWQAWIADRFIWLCVLPGYLLLPTALLIALVIFVSCMAIDGVRLCLFRLLHIDRLTEHAEAAIRRKTDSLFDRKRT